MKKSIIATAFAMALPVAAAAEDIKPDTETCYDFVDAPLGVPMSAPLGMQFCVSSGVEERLAGQINNVDVYMLNGKIIHTDGKVEESCIVPFAKDDKGNRYMHEMALVFARCPAVQ